MCSNHFWYFGKDLKKIEVVILLEIELPFAYLNFSSSLPGIQLAYGLVDFAQC